MANQQQLTRPGQENYKTFSEFYQDRELDPCRGDVQGLLTRFDVDANPGLTFVRLFEQATSAGPVPQAYLCCSDQGKIYCLHLPSKFPSSFTGRVTPWDGQGFVYLGELIQNYAMTIILPDNAFRAIVNVRAKTVDYIATHLEELGPHGFAPPAVDDAESSVINTRQIMCLPTKYVHLLLRPSGYTLLEVWNTLYPAIVNANELQACTPLLQWLRVASTGTTVRNQAGPSPIAFTLTPPLADDDLINHRLGLLRQVLPALFRPQSSYEAAITQMAVAVTENTNDNRLAREAKAADAAAPKLPSDKFGLTLPLLLEYLEIANEQNVPNLWHQLAACTKRQEFQVINEQIQLYSRSQSAFTASTPGITTKLAQDLVSFLFVGDVLDDIKTGLQPFAIASGTMAHRQANLEIAQMYGLLTSGDHAIQLSDLELLKSKEVQSVPLTYYEMERNLGMFGNLLGTVLGTNHRVTVAYRSFWDLLTSTFRDQVQQKIDDKRFVKPAHILRSIHLKCFMWFSQRKMRQRPADPDFASLLDALITDTYVIPHLPPALYKLAYAKATTPTQDTQSVISNTPSLGSTTNGSSSSGASTVISGLTTPTVITSGTTKGTYLVNLTPDRDIQNLVDYGTKLTTLVNQAPPPSMDSGQQMCLSYFVRGGCWTTCKRSSTHARQLTPTEKQRLMTYLREQMQKIRGNTSVATATTPVSTVP